MRDDVNQSWGLPDGPVAWRDTNGWHKTEPSADLAELFEDRIYDVFDCEETLPYAEVIGSDGVVYRAVVRVCFAPQDGVVIAEDRLSDLREAITFDDFDFPLPENPPDAT